MKKLNRIAAIALTLLFTFSNSPASAQSDKIEIQSLEDFRRHLIESSPRVVAAKETWRISTRLKDSAYAALFPSLDLTSSLVADHESDPEPWDQSGAYLKLSTNLYNNHLDWYTYKIAQHQERLAGLQYYTEIGNQILEGLSLYLNFSDRFVTLSVAEQRKKLVDEQYANSRRSYQSGTSTRLDFLRLQSEKMSSEFEVNRARAEFVQAENRLKALFSSEDGNLQFKPLVLGAKEALPTIVTDLSVEDHPEYLIQKEQVKASEYEVTKAQRRYWPRISLDSQWSHGPSSYWVDGENVTWGRDWRTTLSVTFNLFDGGRLSNDLANQRSQVIINQSQAEMAWLRLKSEFENLSLDASILKEQVENAVEILEIETQVFNSISHEYRVGNLGYLDFINSLNRRLSAELNLQTSLSSYLKTYYSSLYHQGVLLNE